MRSPQANQSDPRGRSAERWLRVLKLLLTVLLLAVMLWNALSGGL